MPDVGRAYLCRIKPRVQATNHGGGGRRIRNLLSLPVCSTIDLLVCLSSPFLDRTSSRYFIAILLLGLTGCDPSPAACSTRAQSPIVEAPSTIALGDTEVGRILNARLELRCPEPLTIDRVESSCPCVRVTPTVASLEPGVIATLDVAFDPSEDPDFHGSLSVRLEGYSGRRLAFTTRAKIHVK